MNPLQRFEYLCRTNAILDQNEEQSSSFNEMMILQTGEEEVHSLSHSFGIILWKNTQDARIITSWNLGPPVSTHIKAGMSKLHRHDYIEMAYVVKGEFSQMIGGRKQTFSQGSVCIIDRNSEHADYVTNQENFVIFICMKEDFFDEMFLSEIEKSNVQQFIRQALLKQKHVKQFLLFTPQAAQDDIYPLIEQICIEKLANLKGAHYVIKGYTMRIFYYLTRDYEMNLTESQKMQMNQLLFLEIDHYLRSNYKHASLSALSHTFHFQEDYFNRLLKKHTGLTFSEYLRKIRISKAEEMLLTTRMSIAQIIESVGYSNRNHFYKMFRDIHQMTPEQYRQAKAFR